MLSGNSCRMPHILLHRLFLANIHNYFISPTIFLNISSSFRTEISIFAPFLSSCGGRGTRVRRPSRDSYHNRRTRVPRPP